MERTYIVGANAPVTIRTNYIPGFRAAPSPRRSRAPWRSPSSGRCISASAQRLWNGGHEAAAVAGPPRAGSWRKAVPVRSSTRICCSPTRARGHDRHDSVPAAGRGRRDAHVPLGRRAGRRSTWTARRRSSQTPMSRRRSRRRADRRRARDVLADPFTNWYEAHASAGVTPRARCGRWPRAKSAARWAGARSCCWRIRMRDAATAPVTFLRAGRRRSSSPDGRRQQPRHGRAPAGRPGRGRTVRRPDRHRRRGVPIVVEHAIYFNGPGGQFWAPARTRAACASGIVIGIEVRLRTDGRRRSRSCREGRTTRPSGLGLLPAPTKPSVQLCQIIRCCARWYRSTPSRFIVGLARVGFPRSWR